MLADAARIVLSTDAVETGMPRLRMTNRTPIFSPRLVVHIVHPTKLGKSIDEKSRRDRSKKSSGGIICPCSAVNGLSEGILALVKKMESILSGGELGTIIAK